MTNSSTRINTTVTQSIDFEAFREMAGHCEAWTVRTISMMAELRVFFKYDDLLIAKRYLEKGEMTNVGRRNAGFLAETSEEEIQRIRQLALIKSIRNIVDLNNMYKKEFGRPLMRKIKKDDEGFFDLKDTVSFFMDFELAFNAHYNPENIDGYDFCDIPWYTYKSRK